jgi:hypothetical protein
MIILVRLVSRIGDIKHKTELLFELRELFWKKLFGHYLSNVSTVALFSE